MSTALRIASVFSDHAVLQRDVPLRVWGWAEPGTSVAVAVAGHTAKGTANAAGKWAVTLPPIPAGGPHTLTVRAAGELLSLADIMIGEVWLCSGQSNMEMRVCESAQAESEIADAANWPGLRLLWVPRISQASPAEDRPGMAWKLCSPDTIAKFSAVAFSYGRHLNRELGVAIGLIDSSWGGTNAETWSSRESLVADPALRQLVANIEKPPEELVAARKAWQAKMDAFMARVGDPGNKGWPGGWADPATSDRDWTEIALPQHWQTAGFKFSGVLWFRKEIDIPAAWAGKPIQLCIGACDKSDITYFNNVAVGSIKIEEQGDAWCTERKYEVPGHLVRAGRNVIAVRVYSHIYAGGMTGPAETMRVTSIDSSRNGSIPLAGTWRCKVERNFGQTTPFVEPAPIVAGDVNSPYALYCGMIAPLVPYGIRGAIWYQGESNIPDGPRYLDKMKALIGGWRKLWQQDFPFYFVQLTTAVYAEDKEKLAITWEAQTDALTAVPNTGMAVTHDITSYPDCHGQNKKEVGRRLSLWALAKTYGKKDLVYSGPLYKSMSIESGRIRIQFDHVGGGLAALDGKPLNWFTIAGEDRTFVPSEAVIDGNSVVVYSAAVPKPIAVRFGWREDAAPNLMNKERLPASAFRTDRW